MFKRLVKGSGLLTGILAIALAAFVSGCTPEAEEPAVLDTDTQVEEPVVNEPVTEEPAVQEPVQPQIPAATEVEAVTP